MGGQTREKIKKQVSERKFFCGLLIFVYICFLNLKTNFNKIFTI